MMKPEKTVKKHGQQGDLLFRRLPKMPDGEARLISRNRCILADGEHTGHQHIVEDSDAELYRIGERMILTLNKAATVTHQEHGPITFSPGIWDIGRVREYDPFQDMTRRVQD